MSDPKHENQSSICTWAELTFGETNTLRLIARAMMEAGELLAAAESGMEIEILNEASDVMIVLCRVADRYGIDAFSQDVSAAPGDTAALAAFVGNCIGRMSFVYAASGLNDPEIPRLVKRSAGTLFWIARTLKCDLASVVTAKMKVNRARKWVKPTGALFHTRPDRG